MKFSVVFLVSLLVEFVIALGATIKGLTRDLQPAFVLHFNLVSKLICKRSQRSHGLSAPVKQGWRFVSLIL